MSSITDDSSTEALLLATLSAFFNGSFAAFAKFTPTPIDPILFSFYNSVGVFLSSFIVAPTLLPILHELPRTSIFYAGSSQWSFSYLGIIAGSLYVLAAVFSFAAVKFIGLGVGQGVWGGAAILVSFLWGVGLLGNSVQSVGIAIVSLLTLLIGVAGIALNDVVANILFCRQTNEKINEEDNITEESFILNIDKKNDDADLEKSEANSHMNAGNEINDTQSFILGIACALSVGVFGGSILVPMSFVDDSLSGLSFLPTFGIGSLFASTFILIIYYGFIIRESPFVCNTSISSNIYGIFLGICSGIVWNAGNVCSIFAINGIGYATAYPILQCALFFGGLWGIFLFKEVTDKRDIFVFFLSALVLFAGAVLLSINTSA